MFRASSCPSSGAYQLQQPLVYRRNVVVALLLAVVGPVRMVGWWLDDEMVTTKRTVHNHIAISQCNIIYVIKSTRVLDSSGWTQPVCRV